MDELVAPTLKLLAFDAEDLAVLSAHLQDMTVQAGDLAWLPADRAFALAGERFDWVGVDKGRCERVLCGLHFDGVSRVRKQALEGRDELNLLSMTFEETDAPAGAVTLVFSGGATVRLDVECLDLQMRDLGRRRPCDGKPEHAAKA